MIELSHEVWIKHYLDIADEFLKPKAPIVEPPTFWSQMLEMVINRGKKNKKLPDINLPE